MLDEKSINAVKKIFSKHDYIMTTAQLDSYRIYYEYTDYRKDKKCPSSI